MKAHSVPEISVQEIAQKLQEVNSLVVLDVREPYELDWARLPDPRVVYAPLNQLAASGLAALPEAAQDRQAEIIVICHHGLRSADVTAWLRQQGWERVSSLRGGLDAYARFVDPTIGKY